MSEAIIVLGRRFISDTIATQTEDGVWKLEVHIKELKSSDGDKWEEKEVNAVAFSDDMDDAYNIAVTSVMEQFSDALEAGNGNSMFKDE